MAKKYAVIYPGQRFEYVLQSDAEAHFRDNPGATGMEEVEEVEPVPPGPDVPHSLPVWRLQAILSIMGLKPQIDTAIEGLPEPNRTIANAAWSAGADIERGSSLVGAIAEICSLSEAEVDAIFVDAFNIPV